jgi:hypothetical protein
MTPRHTPWKIAAGMLAATAMLTLTACSNDTEANGAEAHTSSSPSPTESLSPEDRAIQQAEPVIRGYYDAYEVVLKNPARGPRRFEQVAKGRELRDLRAEWRLFRSKGVHVEGTGRIAELTITHADVEADPAVVEVDVCFDVSKADVVDRQGRVVTAKEREDKSLRRMRLTNDDWPGGRWMVSWTEAKNEACT